nr:peptidoglycan DD-metalloendopeptidase family protein [Myxococcota bacterium]
MSRRHSSCAALVALCAVVLSTSCAPSEPPGAAESNISAAVRRERATLIRDTAAAAGITNGLMIAMLAEEETYLSHCSREFPACPGPAHADCGGSSIISGGGDGPCSINQGGLGMFQIDDGTEDDTVRAHGAGVLSLRGNTSVAIERLIQKTQRSRYLPGTAARADAIAFINRLRIDDGSWDNWIRTLVRYWNGCPEGGRCWSNRYPKYDTAARTLYREMGHAFWYGGETPMPPPAGSGWIASPIESPRVTSPVSNRRGTGWARHDCTPLTRANHRGTDFGVAVGTPVHAAAAGTVIRSVTGCPANGSMSSTCGGGFGNHVIMVHDGGFGTLYAHLSPGGGQVRDGARVACGDVLGNSGNSGRSTGPHLHFEVRSNVRDVASYYASSAVTLDPYGGACSSQPEALWISGAPTRACTAMGERDDSVVTRATHAGEVRGSAGTRITQVFTWRNTGTTTWTPEGYVLRHSGGAFAMPAEVRLPAGTMVAPGGSIELQVEVTVPATPGVHAGRWRIARVGGAHFGREGTLSVRVDAAPRACESATLGTTVPDGECVQVSYPGCGMESCAWYRCSNGSWYCTDMGTCGETHPNDACGAPPGSDGGVSGGDGGGSCSDGE